jgi:hypothetical protein
MNLSFKKQNNTGLWIAAGIGVVAAAAGALTWFFLRNSQDDTNTENNVPDYIQRQAGRPKKHRSDVSELHTVTPAHTEE